MYTFINFVSFGLILNVLMNIITTIIILRLFDIQSEINKNKIMSIISNLPEATVMKKYSIFIPYVGIYNSFERMHRLYRNKFNLLATTQELYSDVTRK